MLWRVCVHLPPHFIDRVHRDFLGGVLSKANGMPIFFINGVCYDGAWDRVIVAKSHYPLWHSI